MTIEQMRALVGLPGDATDAAVVAAYADLIDDGMPASIVLVEPVTVEQARLHTKMEDDIEDTLIAQKIRSAREWIEDFTGRIVAQRTLVQHFSSWGGFLELQHRPVVSVDAVAYDGTDGDASLTDYRYVPGRNPPRIFPGDSGFPTLATHGGVTVAFTAGYDANEVPQSIVEAILVLVMGMLDERDGGYDKSLRAAENLLSRLRIMAI